jgi:hypothetical protein
MLVVSLSVKLSSRGGLEGRRGGGVVTRQVSALSWPMIEPVSEA